MGRWSKSIISVIAAATLIGVGGCAIPPNRTGFLEKLSSENRKIARSTRSFHSAVAPLKEGKQADASRVRSAYDEMEKAVKEVQADMEAQALPASSSSAKPLLSAYKEYLNGEQKILTDDFQPIVKKVEELGGNPAAAPFVDAQLAKVVADENTLYRPLEEAQKNYASEHNYTVQSLQTYIDAQKAGKQ